MHAYARLLCVKQSIIGPKFCERANLLVLELCMPTCVWTRLHIHGQSISKLSMRCPCNLVTVMQKRQYRSVTSAVVRSLALCVPKLCNESQLQGDHASHKTLCNPTLAAQA